MTITGTVTMERLENRIIRATISDFPNKSILCTKDEMNLNFKSDTNKISFYSDGVFYENIPMGNVTILGVVINNETTFNTQVGLLFKDAVEDGLNEIINSLDVMTIATVLDFAPLEPKPAIKVIIVRDVIRGGEFRRYSGTYADDQGIVFTDALGGKWFRRIRDNHIDVRWFGMYMQLFDDNPPFTTMDSIMYKVMDAALDPEVISSPNIYFPPYDGNGDPEVYAYYFQQPIELTYPINIFSDGKKARLLFIESLYAGVVVELNAAGSVLKNLIIQQYRDQPFFLNMDNQNGGCSGVLASGKLYAENVDILFFDGNGFTMFGAFGEGDVRYSTLINCMAKYNNQHGFQFSGNQAHSCTIINCRSIYNGGIGFDIQSQTGTNTLIGCYTNGNSTPTDNALQRSVVTDGVNIYQCIADGTHNQALTNTANWIRLDNFFSGSLKIKTYNANSYYYRGGGFDIDSSNDTRLGISPYPQMQKSVLIGCQSDKNEPPSYMSSKTAIVGGMFESNSNGDVLYYSPHIFNNIGVDNSVSAGIKEIEFTTSDSSQVIIARDFYLNRAVCYEVDIVAVAPGFDMWITKRRITITGKKSTDVTAVKQNITVGTEQKDAGINTATFGAITNDTTIGVYNCALYVTGVAGTTVHWKIHIRKLFTSINF